MAVNYTASPDYNIITEHCSLKDYAVCSYKTIISDSDWSSLCILFVQSGSAMLYINRVKIIVNYLAVTPD